MPDPGPLAEYLAGPQVDPAVSALRPDYRALLFILDALAPMTSEALDAAADDLVARLTRLGPGVRAARRLIAPARPLL